MRHRPERWVLPVERGDAPFGYFQKKTIPLIKETDGSIALRVNNAAGARTWSVSEGDDPEAKT